MKVKSVRDERSIIASNKGNLNTPVIGDDSKLDQYELKEPKLLKEIR